MAINKRKTVYKPLPKFPAVERDFAMLCDADIPVGNLEKAISQGAGRLLEKIELFDRKISEFNELKDKLRDLSKER